MKRQILFAGLLLAGMAVWQGCKKDFSTAGFHTLKDENFRFETYRAKIRTYTAAVERVLAQNPSVINLGIYEQPAFGLSSADLLIQFGNTSAFGSLNFQNADSILFVELRIPYFSSKNEDLSTDTDPVYDLDSIFGSTPIKVQVFESGYFLFPYDVQSGLIQSNYFYSDFNFLAHTRSLLAEDPHFLPDGGYIVDTLPVNGSNYLEQPDDFKMQEFNTDTLPPRFVMSLDTAFFRQKFLERAGRPVLTDEQRFKNYFRGLYIHVEPLTNGGMFMMLNPMDVQLVLAYRYTFRNLNGTPNDPSDDYTDYAYEKLVLRPSMMIQHYENNYIPAVIQKIQAPDPVNGEEKTYVKGDAGLMTKIKLFDPVELYELRNNDWLINQVNLRLYIDEAEMSGIDESEIPEQLYLYNAESGGQLADLELQTDDGAVLDINDVIRVYDGSLHTDDETGERYYEFNITRHIKRVLRKDSANVELGLRVCDNILNFLQNMAPVKDPDAFSPFGTVLQGNRAADRPAELIIYYTKPEEE